MRQAVTSEMAKDGFESLPNRHDPHDRYGRRTILLKGDMDEDDVFDDEQEEEDNEFDDDNDNRLLDDDDDDLFDDDDFDVRD